MLQDQIISIHNDAMRAIKNDIFSRNISFYIRYVKEEYADYMQADNIYVTSLFRKNKELLIKFIETKLELKAKAYTTFNKVLDSLLIFYKYLNKRNIVTLEDLYIVKILLNKYRKKPPLLQKKERYLQLTDLYRIINNSKKRVQYQDPIRFKTILFFIYYTGIRRIELSDLKRSDFDLVNCSVKIRNRVCYYPSEIRDMLKVYFESEEEIKNAFNFTNAVAGRFNKILNRYRYLGEKVDLEFLRDTNANLIMKKTKNIGVLAKLHGILSKRDIKQFELKDKEVEYIYKKKIHYFKERSKKK